MSPAPMLPLHILIIDDDEWNVAYLTEVLAANGFNNLGGLTDPREVEAYVQSTWPDVVLLDLHMPYLDGFEVLAYLRDAVPANGFLPVLIISADDDKDARSRAFVEGAIDFLKKPFDELEVVSRVSNLVSSRMLHLQVQERSLELRNAIELRWKVTEDLNLAEARLASLADGLTESALIDDENRQIVFCNAAFCRLASVSGALGPLNGLGWQGIAARLGFHDCTGFLARAEAIHRSAHAVSREPWELAEGGSLLLSYIPVAANEEPRGGVWRFASA